MSKSGTFLSVCAAAALIGCGGAQPVENTNEECPQATAGKSCITFTFKRKDSVKPSANGDFKGTLHWALYKGGDVTLLGPGENKALYEGEAPDVDLLPDGASTEIVIPEVEPQRFQLLSYLDDDMSGASNPGDPVTFPKDPFGVPANRHAKLEILFDYIY
jgi:hypothetical protein